MTMRLVRSDRRVAHLLAIALTLATACRSLTDPPLPEDAVPFSPPPVYARWWAMTEACSGISQPLGRVRWYVVPGVQTIESRGREVNGYWSAGSNQIVLAGASQFSAETVRHEMLHALAGRSGHSRELFLRRCAGVVRCASDCIGDAEPPQVPDPSALVVLPATLNVGIQFAPRDPVGPDGDGFLTLIVTARNPDSRPVVVRQPLESATGYFFEIVSADGLFRGRVPWIDAEATSFRPGETKRHVFDLRIATGSAGGIPLSPGEYTFRGGYGRHFAGIVVRLED